MQAVQNSQTAGVLFGSGSPIEQVLGFTRAEIDAYFQSLPGVQDLPDPAVAITATSAPRAAAARGGHNRGPSTGGVRFSAIAEGGDSDDDDDQGTVAATAAAAAAPVVVHMEEDMTVPEECKGSVWEKDGVCWRRKIAVCQPETRPVRPPTGERVSRYHMHVFFSALSFTVFAPWETQMDYTQTD